MLNSRNARLASRALGVGPTTGNLTFRFELQIAVGEELVPLLRARARGSAFRHRGVQGETSEKFPREKVHAGALRSYRPQNARVVDHRPLVDKQEI